MLISFKMDAEVIWYRTGHLKVSEPSSSMYYTCARWDSALTRTHSIKAVLRLKIPPNFFFLHELTVLSDLLTIKQKDVGSRQKIENPRDLFIYASLTPILNAFPSCHEPMQFNETFPLSQGKLGSSFQHIFRCILGKCETPWHVARINKFLRCFLRHGDEMEVTQCRLQQSS